MKVLVLVFGVLFLASVSFAQVEDGQYIEAEDLPEDVSEMAQDEVTDNGGLPHFTKWLVKGCEEGRAQACFRMGKVLDNYSRGQKSTQYYQAGCELGDSRSCEKAPALTPPIEDEMPPTMIAEEPTAEKPSAEKPTVEEAERSVASEEEALPPPPPPVSVPTE